MAEKAKKLKVLFIWHAAVVKTYQRYIAELAEHNDLSITLLLPKKDMEGSQWVKAYVPKEAKYKVIVGTTILSNDNMTSIFPALPLYLLQIKPDIIHMFEEPYHNIAAYMTFWSKIICPKAKLIFQTFQNQVEKYRNVWVKIQNKTFERSSAAIACAEEMKTVLLYWRYKKTIHVIYPGIETAIFNQASAYHLKQKLGINRFCIGYFGRMLKEKGVEDLIAASKRLTFPHQLLFIGNGKDKEYFKKLAPDAIWIDAIDPNDINQYYNALDVFVLPSRTTANWKEQFGRVLVEAMLCGVPVIGSSSGEIPNVIGDAGLVFKEQEVQDLAEKISAIHNDPALRESLVSKGLNRGKIFDWKITADKTYAVYQSVLKS